jgi:alkylation response protein AidB-like acyl-CoA dehydrogenase
MSAALERPFMLTPSAACAEAVATFRAMLEDWRGSPANTAPAHAPMTGEDLWPMLARDGWTLAGRDLGGDGAPTARDLVEIAEAWGHALGAAPFLETLLLARWHAGLAGDVPASFAIPLATGGALVPFGGTATAQVRAANGSWSALPTGMAQDGFAPSLPIAMRPDLVATLDPEMTREAAAAYVATAVGCADRCLARTIEHTSSRIAYGRAVVTFQALRHIIADMYRDVELARSGVVGALHEADWRPLLENSADLAQRVVARAIQLHGGMGFTWEMGLHFQSRHILVVRKLLRALAGEA